MCRAGGLRTALASLIVAGPAWATEVQPEQVRIEVEFPKPGKTIGGEQSGVGMIRGRAVGFQGEIETFDVMFVIDVSGSTAEPSGSDIDGDGEAKGSRTANAARRGLSRFVPFLGGRGRDNPDSILAAEIAAVRGLLAQLDPRSTRAGVVIFSGDENPGTDDALLEAALTADYTRVTRALDQILLVPPQGATNMEAGLALARRELMGGRAAESERRTGAQKHIVFLTDGQATTPGGEREATQRALDEARKAAKNDIKIMGFAIGPEATSAPRVPSEAARLTGGRFVAVKDPGKLTTEVSTVRFTNIEKIELRNRTLDAAPTCEVITPEGRFAALVPMRPGANTLEVRARSSAGTEKSVSVDAQFSADQASSLEEVERTELARLRAICEIKEKAKERDRKIQIETGSDAP